MEQTGHVSTNRRTPIITAAVVLLLLVGLVTWDALDRVTRPAEGDLDDETAANEAASARRESAAPIPLPDPNTPLAPLNPPTAPPTTGPPKPPFEAPFGSTDTAYVILVGGPWKTVALDLMSGEMREGPSGLVNPVLVVDDYVVWRTESTGALGFSPLKDLDDVQPLNGAGPSTEVAAGVRPNSVMWVDGASGANMTVREVSLTTNEVVAEADLNGWTGSVRLTRGAEFVSPASGGVYRWSPTGYERVLADGRVTAQGHGLLMVFKCDERLRCRNEWHDTTNYEELSLATPPAGSSPLSGRLLGGHWISISSPDDRNDRSELLDVRTGQLVSDVSRLWAEHPVDVTPDGDLVVGALGGEVQLIDLISGDRAIARFPTSVGMREIQSVFLVPRSALGDSLAGFDLIQPSE